jgi:hypothetical protein
MTTYGAEPLGGLDGELEVLERVLVVRGVAPREIEPGDWQNCNRKQVQQV